MKISVQNRHQKPLHPLNHENKEVEVRRSSKKRTKLPFFSPANESSLPAPWVIKQEEREIVVDSGASMHMLSRKDLNSAVLKTVRVSQSPTMVVVAANCEVHTKEEATVYVKDLDLFVKVKLLDDTPAVLSLGKLCQDHGYSFEWTSGQLQQLIKKGRRVQWRNTKPRKKIGSFAEDKIAYMIYDYFRVIGAHDTVLEYAVLFTITLRNGNVQEFDTRWDEILLSKTKSHRMIFWKT